MKEKIENLVWAVFNEFRSSGFDKHASFDVFISLITWKVLSDGSWNTQSRNGRKWQYPDRAYFYDEVIKAQGQINFADKIMEALKKWELVNAPEFSNLLLLENYNLQQIPKSIWKRISLFFESINGNIFGRNDNQVQLVSVLSDLLSYLETLVLQDEWGTSYYTPKEVAELMTSLVADQNFKSLYDPYCKAGDLLVVAQQQLKSLSRINGITIGNLQWKLAMLRLLIFKIHPDTEISIFNDLDFHNEQNFDVILANPPFGSTTPEKSQFLLSHGKWTSLLQPTSRIDTLYLCHILDKLSDIGRAAIILPSIFLSGKGELKRIREQIIDENMLDAVITLPAGVFPQTGVSTVLLILHKNRQHNDIIMFNATKEFKREGKHMYLDGEVMTNFVRWYKDRDIEHIDQIVLIRADEIIANDYDLKFSSYQNCDSNILEDLTSSKAILNECMQIETELKAVKERMIGLLKKMPNQNR